MSKVLDASSNFGIRHVNLKTKEGAQSSLGAIDKMMSDIGSSRAQLGSMSNRIGSVMNNLLISRENISESSSKIRDTDIAKEVAIKMKGQIAQSASLAMLKNSNEQPNVILKLVS
jgi:flagellin